MQILFYIHKIIIISNKIKEWYNYSDCQPNCVYRIMECNIKRKWDKFLLSNYCYAFSKVE